MTDLRAPVLWINGDYRGKSAAKFLTNFLVKRRGEDGVEVRGILTWSVYAHHGAIWKPNGGYTNELIGWKFDSIFLAPVDLDS